MKPRRMLTIGVAIATALWGTASAMGAASGDTDNGRAAAADAQSAREALQARKTDAAIRDAEAAVAKDPQNAGHRALLGQAYLLAGRFTAAAQVLDDSLALDPQQNGRTVLNLALARIATGEIGSARTLLADHAGKIGPSDLGLALALAGDPAAAVDILAPAAREAGATAKLRQNLALALALAGRWGDAKAVAAMDIAPDQLNERLTQWASFARPAHAHDQVAALLGTQAVQDAGLPAGLALARTPEATLAESAPTAAPAPVSLPETAAAAPPPLRPATVQPLFPGRKPRMPAPKAVAAPMVAGPYVVQLGAFDNAAVARDAWQRLRGRVSALARHVPHGTLFANGRARLYRLSVGGFARGDADALCRAVKAGGGTCFVRMAAGDTVADWYKPATRVAAR